MPDEQAGRVIEAGMGEIEIIADADGAGIGVVAAEDRAQDVLAPAPRRAARRVASEPDARRDN